MIEEQIDMWSYLGIADAICITTNGYTKSNGRSVMGRGCAKEALNRYKDIDFMLGILVNKNKVNKVSVLLVDNGTSIVNFPVKPVSEICLKDKSNVVKHNKHKFNVGDIVPGWSCIARESCITSSLDKLVALANANSWNKIILPRPGCGVGELDWDSHVSILCEQWLDDRFIIVNK